MGILDELLGSGPLRRTFDDFMKRYDTGHPAEGYSDEEVVERYKEVAHAVPADQYTQAATEALSRLSPEERAEFLALLQERARQRGVALPTNVGSNPKELGQVVTEIHEKPGRLRDILGGGSASSGGSGSGPLGNIFASPVAKAALAGIAAMLVKRVMRGSAQ